MDEYLLCTSCQTLRERWALSLLLLVDLSLMQIKSESIVPREILDPAQYPSLL